jgi:hypothetical protein
MALIGLWVPSSWWRGLAASGAVLSVILMILFLDPTKVLPIAVDLVAVAAATGRLPLAFP